MFGSLFIASTVAAIHEALTASAIDGVVVVVCQPRIGAGLRQRGVSVVQVSERVRGLRRLDGLRVCAAEHQLPFASASVAAVVGFGVGESAGSEDRLTEWQRVVRDGGAIVLVDRGSPSDHTRRALCAGLCEIEQRHAGRTVVTNGLVTKLAS